MSYDCYLKIESNNIKFIQLPLSRNFNVLTENNYMLKKKRFKKQII